MFKKISKKCLKIFQKYFTKFPKFSKISKKNQKKFKKIAVPDPALLGF